MGKHSDCSAIPNLPPLNDQQAEKLRLLSLLTLATNHVPLTYDAVMKSLSLPDHGALESLVTKAIYSSLITARLSPATAPPTIYVTSTAPLRDVRPQTITSMISVLAEWQERCGDVIKGIDAEIVKIKSDATERRAKEKSKAFLIENSLKGNFDKDNDDTAGGGAGSSLGLGSGGGGGAGGAGSKHFSPFSKEGQAGLKQYFGSGGRNKREFSDTNDYAVENRTLDEGFGDSEMDVDSTRGESGEARHTKRILAGGRP